MEMVVQVRNFILISLPAAVGALLAVEAAAYSPSIVPLAEIPDQLSQEYCREMTARAVKNNPEHPPAEDAMFPLYRSPPSWPKRMRGRQGSVKLEFTVGTDGRPKDIKVVEASATEFAEEAVRTLKKWRYCPAFKDGVPVESDTKLTLNFARR